MSDLKSELETRTQPLQDLLANALWAAPDCITLINQEGLILQINAAGLSMINASAKDLVLGQAMTNWISPRYQDIWRQYHRRVCSGETSVWEFEIAAHLGSHAKWVESHASPYTLPSGEIVSIAITRDSTEKKNLESRHHQLFEELPQLIWISSADTGQTLFVNSRCIDYKGFDATKKKDGGWTHSLHPEEESTICALWENAKKTGQTFEAEYRLRAKDGSYRWFIGRAIPTRDQHGKITEWLGTCTDIDDRRRAEAALRLQSQITKIMTDNAASSLFMTDRRGRATFMNPAAEKMTGFKIEELLDKKLHDAIHYCRPDRSAYPAEECPIENAQEDGLPIRNQEEMFIDREGRLYPVAYSVSPLKSDGKVIGSVLEFRDISEQRKTQEALEDSVRNLKTLAKVGQTLSAELGLEKLKHAIIDAAIELSRAQFGTFVFDRAAGNTSTDARQVARYDDITIQPPTVQQAIYQAIPTAIGIRSYLAVPIISNSGALLGVLHLGHEKAEAFTDREVDVVRTLAGHAATALDNASLFEKSEHAIRARDEFLSIASHELKTPLTSLKLQSQLLKRAIEKEDPTAYSKERVNLLSQQTERQVTRLSRLIDDMLDISRIQTGKLTIDPEELDFVELVQDVIERMTVQFVVANVAMPTVSFTGRPRGRWDRMRLEQVITNLLTNAIRYGKGNAIEIKLDSTSTHVLLSVKDHGIGIHPEAQGKIFDRFERAVNANEVSGLGLGLFITQQIVQAHKGRIWVESKVDEGSTFYVELPLYEPSGNSNGL